MLPLLAIPMLQTTIILPATTFHRPRPPRPSQRPKRELMGSFRQEIHCQCHGQAQVRCRLRLSVRRINTHHSRVNIREKVRGGVDCGVGGHGEPIDNILLLLFLFPFAFRCLVSHLYLFCFCCCAFIFIVWIVAAIAFCSTSKAAILALVFCLCILRPTSYNHHKLSIYKCTFLLSQVNEFSFKEKKELN